MNYRFLSEQLRPTAEGARRFFRQRWGVTSFKAEESVSSETSFSPTLQAETSDHHLLCVEVSKSPYPSALDSFVVDCMRLCIPVKLFVAISEDSMGPSYNRDLERARKCGVGVLEVRKSSSTIIHAALSLSLTGVRPVDLKKFPAKYRQALSDAEDTFRNGQPSKGCSLVYDEVEDLTRKIAKQTFDRGLWLHGRGARLKFDKDPWQNVLREMMGSLDYSRCASITYDLLARTVGITPHRNDSSHKPKSRAQLTKRDRELRTRFENAADLFLDLMVAGKSAGLRP
jgi:hypothetical protein